jgi:A/G-specific adenine glycosylase
VAAIAFGRPAVPVDGNVERVMARLFAVETPLPGAKRRLAALAREVGAQAPARARPGDFAQALFDLGATVCTPRRPECALCPWRRACAGLASGLAESLPRRTAKAERPLRFGVAFWLEDEGGRVLLRRRPARGLLGGMLELPGTPWRTEAWDEAEAQRHAPAHAAWVPAGAVRHVFTHFALELRVLAGRVSTLPVCGEVVGRGAVLSAGLPGVMAKAARVGLRASEAAESVSG